MGLLRSAANFLKTATGAVDVKSAAAPTSGQVLTATGASTATWQTPAGGGATCLTLIPQSPLPWDDGSDAGAAVQMNSNTTAFVGQIIVPFGITVNKLTIRTGATVTTAGTFDIVIYNETGQTQEISVTTASINATDTLFTTAVSAVALSAGIHYILIVPNSTADANIIFWQSQPNPPFSGTMGFGEDVSGEPIIQGTLTVTASTPPATFDPAAITPVVQLRTLICRLDN